MKSLNEKSMMALNVEKMELIKSDNVGDFKRDFNEKYF